MKSEHYSYNAFNFSQSEIIWVLHHLEEMKVGLWPSSHKYTSYTDAPINIGRPKSHADFTDACDIAADIELRLKKCGRDGDMVKTFYVKELEFNDYATILYLTNKELGEIILRVMKYVSGKKFWGNRGNYDKSHKEIS